MYRYIDRYYPSWFYPAAATTTTTGGASCASGLEQNIADGYCDDKNNVEECQWDGGDCCLDTVLTDYCDDCACLDPGAGDSGTTPAGNKGAQLVGNACFSLYLSIIAKIH